MRKIQSKVHNYGHKNESEWPPQFGNRGSGHFYYDSEQKKMVEGYPPYKYERYGTAPMVVFDAIPKRYHEGQCRYIESRKEWDMADKECGTLTFSSLDEAKRSIKSESEIKKEYRKQLRETSKKALDIYRANPREAVQKLEKRAEEQMKVAKQLGITDKQIEKMGVKTK